MINIKISLIYLIIHLVCVIHMFDVFKFSHYTPSRQEKIAIWLTAPFIVLSILVVMLLVKIFGKEK